MELMGGWPEDRFKPRRCFQLYISSNVAINVIAVIMGSGDWSDQTGEEIRHAFGNSLLRKCLKISLTRKFLARVNKKSMVKNTMSKKMCLRHSQKGKEPKISVKDDSIVIDNGLKNSIT